MSLELSGTTGVKGVAGSVAAPSIVGDDTNTGISFPAADTIKFSTGGVERMQITNSGVTGTGISAGKILQVVSTVKTNVFSSNSTSAHDITGMSVAITPSSSSSKVLINIALSYGGDNNMYAGINLLRGSTVVVTGDANVSEHRLHTFGLGGDGNFQYKVASATYTYLDSPSTTSATTYKLQGRVAGSNSPHQYYLINSPYQGGQVNNNANFVLNTSSTITAMEVAA